MSLTLPLASHASNCVQPQAAKGARCRARRQAEQGHTLVQLASVPALPQRALDGRRAGLAWWALLPLTRLHSQQDARAHPALSWCAVHNTLH